MSKKMIQGVKEWQAKGWRSEGLKEETKEGIQSN